MPGLTPFVAGDELSTVVGTTGGDFTAAVCVSEKNASNDLLVIGNEKTVSHVMEFGISVNESYDTVKFSVEWSHLLERFKGLLYWSCL